MESGGGCLDNWSFQYQHVNIAQLFVQLYIYKYYYNAGSAKYRYYLLWVYINGPIGFFEKYAFLQTKMTWYWFIYSYIIWEFGHFIYHFLGHKVRFFWCFHATHHTPEEMNLSVSHAHFFLEAPYADLIRTTICIVLGVEPAMLFTIMFIDGTYGSFIHIGDNMMKSVRNVARRTQMLTDAHAIHNKLTW